MSQQLRSPAVSRPVTWAGLLGVPAAASRFSKWLCKAHEKKSPGDEPMQGFNVLLKKPDLCSFIYFLFFEYLFFFFWKLWVGYVIEIQVMTLDYLDNDGAPLGTDADWFSRCWGGLMDWLIVMAVDSLWGLAESLCMRLSLRVASPRERRCCVFFFWKNILKCLVSGSVFIPATNSGLRRRKWVSIDYISVFNDMSQCQLINLPKVFNQYYNQYIVYIEIPVDIHLYHLQMDDRWMILSKRTFLLCDTQHLLCWG